jgi:hypothetical protein
MSFCNYNLKGLNKKIPFTNHPEISGQIRWTIEDFA